MLLSMNTRLITALAITLAATNCFSIHAADVPDGFVALFNGKNLSGWHGRPHLNPSAWDGTTEEKRAQWNADVKKHWSIQDGVLINDGHGAYLTTDKKYGDIELRLEYKTVARADSGIYLRGTPQVQIWDYTDEAKFNIGSDKGSGGLWNSSAGAKGKDPLELADKPFGEWNSFRIIQIGARTSVWLNDKLVVDHAIMENFWDRKLPLLSDGVIQLQTHGGEIQWKNVHLRELSAEQSNEWLSKKDQESGDFKSLFDGKDLSAWTGAVDNYEVVDGAIQCKSGHGGVLHTKYEFKDFDVTFEFQLPPGGNNGLAIRYPGKDDTAYVGMCELQILDNTHNKFAKLDKRQYHGSAYGMIAAHRGYLREVGQWNYQRVTVKGSTIRVELNGTVILDGDLSKVTDYMASKPHPGKDNESGYFGFAGHNDPVRFRNVSIMPH